MSDDNVIYPTGKCFDDALEFFGECVKQPGEEHRFRLAHGICLMPDEQPNAGQPFAHAWVVEFARNGVLVWSFGIWKGFRIRYSAERGEMYAHLRPQAVTYYTAEEAWNENRRTGHYGPWRAEYLALVRNPVAELTDRIDAAPSRLNHADHNEPKNP